MSIPVMSVLQCLAASREGVPLKALRRNSGIPPASLSRILKRLVEDGYVAKASHGTYAVGPAFRSMSALVVENHATRHFSPLLRALADETGQHAEVYTLTPEGLHFQMVEPGQTQLAITMKPGHRIQSLLLHPGGRFLFHRFPETCAPGAAALRRAKLSRASLEADVKRAARDRFCVVRGGVRPELARAAVPSDGYAYCICLFGFVGDFPKSADRRLKALMHDRLAVFESDRAARSA